MKTGLANMAYGVVIALVGALITGVTYAMVSDGGGTYVVAYGAFIVGAWRFLLGLFQVLRGAVSGPEAGTTVPKAASAASAAPASPIGPASAPRPAVFQDSSGALHGVGWVLIVDAAFRVLGVGSLLSHMRVPLGDLMYNVPFVVFAIALPMVFIVGGLAVGALLLRNLPTAIPLGLALCGAGLLFQAFSLWRLLSIPAFSVSWIAWAFPAVHLAIYLVSLVVLLRSYDRRGLATADIHAAPGTPR